MNNIYTPTGAQLNAINAEGKVIVSAAAGSGKTTTMIERILRHISEGAKLERMLVLVYNNAAAAELKERLYLKLFEAARSASGIERELYRREQDRISFAHIGTIHGFCQSLIRENFEKLDLPPSFEVLSKQAHAAYMKKAMDNVFATLSDANDRSFLDLREIFDAARKEEDLRRNVSVLYEIIDIQPDAEAFKSEILDLYEGFDESAYLKAYVASYKRLFRAVAIECGEIIEPLIRCGAQDYADNTIRIKRACEAAANSVRSEEFVKICAAGTGAVRAVRKRGADEDAVFYTERAKSVRKTVEEAFGKVAELFSDTGFLKKAHAQNAGYAKELIKIVSEFASELDALKRADGVLSFGDLERYAAALLKEDNDYGKDYDFVFVDEYQDVNPIQEFIISSMCGDNCFMVGDVKQSIYGFRLADPTIFISRKENYKKGGGTALEFTQNFRSARNILAFVNAVFDSVMTLESADVDYAGEERFEESSAPEGGLCELHLFTSESAKPKQALGVYNVEAHEDPDESGDASEAEGRFIADTIKSLVGKAKSAGGYVDYGDVAVLVRYGTSGARKIVAALKEEGIPVDGNSFSPDESAPESELIRFLKAIDNPRQDIPFAGYLLSFFGGYREDDLIKISSFSGDCFYDKALARSALSDELGDRLKETFSELKRYRLKSSFESVSELMRSIVSAYSYDAYLRIKGESAVYALESFISSASQKKNCDLSVYLKEYGDSERESISNSGGGSRVTVSTFHSFKGLERDVVFVSDAAVKFIEKSAQGDFIADNGGFIGLSYFDKSQRTKRTSLSREATARIIKERETKEEMRLLYVALTRAKRYLYITASVSGTRAREFGAMPVLGFPSCDLDFISDAVFRGGVKISAYLHKSSEDRAERSAKESGRIILSLPDDKLSARIEAARKFVYPYAEASGLSMKYSVSALDSFDEQTYNLFEDAAKRGTAYHKVMEHIDFTVRSLEGVIAEMSEMTRENILNEEEAALVKPGDILKCLQSDIIKLASESVCLREKSFMMYVPAREAVPGSESDDKVLVQGVVDLLITGEKNIIVDFKTSKLSDKKSIEKYKKQLYLYKKAIESAFSVKIDEVALYSFGTGRTLFL